MFLPSINDCVKNWQSYIWSILKRGNEFELYYDPRRGPLHIDIDYTGLHAGLSDDGLHLSGDVVKAVLGRGGNLYDTLYFIHFKFTEANPDLLQIW